MNVGNLFNQAVNISSAFLRILQEDADLDSSYSLNIAQIEQRYKSKISELDLKRSRRISNASAQDQSAQTNIQDALNALSEAEARIPEKYRKKYRQTSLIPEFPNFQALDELAARINDGSFGGAIKRLTGIGGYTSMMDMVNDYLDHVEAGRMYLRGEQKKSSSYLAQEKASANAEYIREKAVVEQKKANLIARNNQAYDHAGSALQDKLMVAIDDPALMVKLSPKQTRFVSIDAVNHVIEAATSTVASPYAITLAREVVTLVSKYLPKAIENPEDLEARYFLAYAAMMGGVCFDNGLLHYTHALEHPLSAVKHDLSHGLGLAMLLPAVVKNIFSAKAETLKYILEPVVGKVENADEAANGVYEWLKSVGVPNKLKDEGFSEADVPNLVNLAFTTPSLDGLLAIAPTKATKEAVEEIYRNSL